MAEKGNLEDHDLSFGDTLLDSGASHVILPLRGLRHAKPVKLQLASASGKDSLIYESKIQRAKLRQGAMPHVSRRIAIVLRCALRDTRDQPRVIDASEWHSRM
eukprot:206525-Amphidinium_carterae.4